MNQYSDDKGVFFNKLACIACLNSWGRVDSSDKIEKQRAARMAYEQQAVIAYEKMQATGLHFTVDEVKDWAKSLSRQTPK